MDASLTFYGSVTQAVAHNAGTINNFYGRMERHALNQELVVRTRDLYVEPNGLSDAVARLRENHVLTLIGRRGSGLWSAAIVLLERMGVVDQQELVLDEEAVGLPLSDADRQGYILDLRGDRETVPSEFGRRLRSDVDRVRARLSFLVVLADSATPVALTSDLVPVRLSRPDPLDVLGVHLRAGGLPDEVIAGWRAEHEVVAAVRDAPPAEVVRLARQILATPPAPPDQQVVAETLAIYHRWSDHIHGWVAGHDHPGDRALLLAVAAVEGAPPATVLDAADKLAEAVRIEPRSGWPLSAEPVERRIETVGAIIRDDSLRFSRPEYGRAVLEFSWTAWPQLRPVLRGWLPTLATLRTTDAGLPERVKASVLHLGLGQSDAGFLQTIAHQWAANPATRVMAVDVLVQSALHPDTGRATRQALYRWITSASPERPTVHLVAEVSVRLSAAYPEIAMTRLRHVATHGDDSPELAAQSLAAVATEHPDLFGRALREAAGWRADERPTRQRAGRLAFELLVADPAVALNRTSRPALVDGWRAVFGAPATVHPALSAWLDLAPAEPAVLDVLAAAACVDSSTAVVALRLVDTWVKEDPTAVDRVGIRDSFLRQVLDGDPVVRAARRHPVTEEVR